MKNMNETVERIKSYKETLADIKELDFKIQELDGGISRRNENSLGIRLSKSNVVYSEAEEMFERKNELLAQKLEKDIQIKRINNALSILEPEEREIIKNIYINRKRYYIIQDKLNLSYQRIKQLEKQAILKMVKYVLPSW
ncbi:RNA polymerase sigma factor RpoH [Clostridium puniceum]|uniref:RNA polymerase sigma factor RpoH n=1 Tax=Clostridium puniceum TaxID=29367 RepID=A0A1S8T8G0_9CLOT|nr:sigma factor-like helix-turn-helix DNA-binding protein [Clostridium puniceum]OOM73978.1 RNA polymerase sigma factor RpoH [Clostridium puniceum]